MFPCPYGIDFSSKGELIATKKENEKAIADFIGARILHYLSVDGMVKATGMQKEVSVLPVTPATIPSPLLKKSISSAWKSNNYRIVFFLTLLMSISCSVPIASLINVTERRAWIVNVASQKMLPKSGNLFEFHLHDIV